MKTTLLMLGLIIALAGVPAFADQVVHTSTPMSFTILNPCNGEAVDISGSITFDVTMTVNANTVHGHLHENAQDLTGTGETTGAKYQETGAVNSDSNFSATAGVPANADTLVHINLVGQGNVPNFNMDINEHITINADGTVTATVNNVSTTCH